jgi:hypothetical protein
MILVIKMLQVTHQFNNDLLAYLGQCTPSNEQTLPTYKRSQIPRKKPAMTFYYTLEEAVELGFVIVVVRQRGLVDT